MSLNNYNENSIRTLKPREAVRENYSMYIGDNTSKGMHHLLTEIVANSMDEAAAGFGTKIIVKINTKENKASVIDSGRGIPFRLNAEGKYAIKEMCTSLHSGGKFADAGNYKSALGLHGLGATVTNALSKYFSILSAREDGDCILEFKNGEEINFKINDVLHKETGSIVSFIPDDIIFGNSKWDLEIIKEELQLHALLNNNLTFELYCDDKKIINYCYQNGIKDMLKLKFDSDKPITNAIYYNTTIKNGKEECIVELAIQYANDGGERTYAFTNGGYNPDLGTHVTGFRTAWTTLINNKAHEYGLLDNNAGNLDGALIRKGLYVVLSIKMTERPMFAEQTKLKLTSPSARTFVSQAVSKMIIPRPDLEAIIKKALIEKKAEDAAQRKREAERKVSAGGRTLNALRDMPEDFAESIDREGAELFLVEGKSAGGSAKMGRDEHKQAIFALRGKPLNTHSKELADIIKNEEIKNLLTVLGCGIGEKFNIKNLRYDKIIFFADADADGQHINCLLTTLFLYHLPELIKAGKVYCAIPPLYRLKTNKDVVYTSDSVLRDSYAKKGYDVQRLKGLGEMSAQELWESSMDPAHRTLIQLTTDNMEKLITLYDILMGDSSKDRKIFIMEHAREYRLISDEVEGDDE